MTARDDVYEVINDELCFLDSFIDEQDMIDDITDKVLLVFYKYFQTYKEKLVIMERTKYETNKTFS